MKSYQEKLTNLIEDVLADIIRTFYQLIQDEDEPEIKFKRSLIYHSLSGYEIVSIKEINDELYAHLINRDGYPTNIKLYDIDVIYLIAIFDELNSYLLK